MRSTRLNVCLRSVLFPVCLGPNKKKLLSPGIWDSFYHTSSLRRILGVVSDYLGLTQLPFALEADPEFFYASREHKECLQRLKLSVALQKGCSVVLGDIGTGKTTVAETLRMELRNDERFVVRKILNPRFKSEFQFLKELAGLFEMNHRRTTLDLHNGLREFLYKTTVEEEKIVTLIIDEGQLLSMNYLEILRLLLNYQAPKFFFLNLIIFAQLEFLHKLRKKKNFADRVALKYMLNTLNREETRNMIDHRLRVAGAANPGKYFTERAVERIFEISGGRPRRICTICSNLLESAVITKMTFPLGEDLVEHVARQEVEVG